MRNFRRVTPVRAVSLAVIFVFFIVQASIAQAPAAPLEDWSAAASAFERIIAEKLKPGQSVTLALQNMSSLSPEEAAVVRKDLGMELRAQGWQTIANGRKMATASEEGVAEIRVTLAENSQGLLWVAEIGPQENRVVVMQAVPRAAPAGSSASIPAMLLRSQKVYEQEAPVLSFALIDVPGNPSPRLLILEPGLIASYVFEQGRAQSRQAMPVPAEDPRQRNLRGSLIMTGRQSFDIVLPGVNCSGAVQEDLSLRCTRLAESAYPSDERGADIWKFPSRAIEAYSVARIEVQGQPMRMEAGSDGLARLYKPDDQRAPVATFTGWGSDIAGIQSGCGSGWQVLATRAGDWTERDALQAFEIEGKRAVAVSPALEVGGPVLVLKASEKKDTGFAVVRNLQTGRYEAHVLSLSCGR